MTNTFERIIGQNEYGTYVFTALRVHAIEAVKRCGVDRPVWIYSHKNLNGNIATLYSMGNNAIEGIVSTILAEFPDIYSIQYYDEKGLLHESFPARALPNHLSALVTKELER